MDNARSNQAPIRPARARLRTFGCAAICSSWSAITLFALVAPNATTTWLDAWAGSVGIGVLAGLLALWLARPRRRGRRSPLDFLAGLAAASLLARILPDRRRIS